AERRDDVARLERPRRRLGEQRRVEHGVDVVDEDQLRRLRREDPLELAGCVRPREPPSGDDDLVSHGTSIAHLVTQCYKVADCTYAALRSTGLETELGADQPRHLAAIGLAPGLAHHRADDRADRLPL